MFGAGEVKASYCKPSRLVSVTGTFSGISDGFIYFDNVRCDDGTRAARLAVPVVNIVDVRQLEQGE